MDKTRTNQAPEHRHQEAESISDSNKRANPHGRRRALTQSRKSGKRRNQEDVLLKKQPPGFKNIYQAVDAAGEFEPDEAREFEPTSTEPGSREKIEVIRSRLEQGLPMWHPQDRVHEHADFDGTDYSLARLRSVSL
jgi:hypothetical protein